MRTGYIINSGEAYFNREVIHLFNDLDLKISKKVNLNCEWLISSHFNGSIDWLVKFNIEIMLGWSNHD